MHTEGLDWITNALGGIPKRLDRTINVLVKIIGCLVVGTQAVA